MAIGPISRTGIPPIPESRSLVPVVSSTAPPAQVDAVDRKTPRRQNAAEKGAGRVAERDRDSTTNEATESRAGDRAPTVTAPPAGTASAGQSRRDWHTPGSAPFVTQVLAQEVLRQGLYIEPWRQAVSAYERAAETAGPRIRYQMP